jgi:hypothetical protein
MAVPAALAAMRAASPRGSGRRGLDSAAMVALVGGVRLDRVDRRASVVLLVPPAGISANVSQVVAVDRSIRDECGGTSPKPSWRSSWLASISCSAANNSISSASASARTPTQTACSVNGTRVA